MYTYLEKKKRNITYLLLLFRFCFRSLKNLAQLKGLSNGFVRGWNRSVMELAILVHVVFIVRCAIHRRGLQHQCHQLSIHLAWVDTVIERKR